MECDRCKRGKIRLLEELTSGDGIYYIPQEKAFAPGIVKNWPGVISHPTDPHGRLVKRIWRRKQ